MESSVYRLAYPFVYHFSYFVNEQKAKEEAAKKKYGALIRVYILGDAIDDMYKDYDKQKGNPSSDETLSYSLNRSLHWLNNRNCAILTAWRGNYSKKEINHIINVLNQVANEQGSSS